MEEMTGVARLRQAIENQRDAGETCFALPIGEAYAICDEVDDELARLGWAKDVPAPVDADGEVVPLSTEVMYDDDGEEREGSIYRSFILSHEMDRWYFGVPGGAREVASLRLHRPDSGEKLAEDIESVSNSSICAYFGWRGKPCEGCRAFIDENSNCKREAMRDVLRRAEALAKRDAKEFALSPSPHEAKEGGRA